MHSTWVLIGVQVLVWNIHGQRHAVASFHYCRAVRKGGYRTAPLPNRKSSCGQRYRQAAALAMVFTVLGSTELETKNLQRVEIEVIGLQNGTSAGSTSSSTSARTAFSLVPRIEMSTLSLSRGAGAPLLRVLQASTARIRLTCTVENREGYRMRPAQLTGVWGV